MELWLASAVVWLYQNPGRQTIRDCPLETGLETAAATKYENSWNLTCWTKPTICESKRRCHLCRLESVTFQGPLDQQTCESIEIEVEVDLLCFCIPEDSSNYLDLWRGLKFKNMIRQWFLCYFLPQSCQLRFVAYWFFLQQKSNLVDDHLDGHPVLHSSRDHNVRHMPLWLNILQIHWFHKCKPLLDHPFNGPTSFTNITDDLLTFTSAITTPINQKCCLLLRDRQRSASAST